MMNHRRTTTLAHVLFGMLLLATTNIEYCHAKEEALAALFCEGSSKVRTETGELYPCWTDEDDDSKSRRDRRLAGKGGGGKNKDECDIIEMDGEDSFDDFKDFEGVSTYLIECGKNARAGLCTEDGDDYEAEEECDNGDAAVITILYLDDYRRGRRQLGLGGSNSEVEGGDDVGSETSSHRRSRRSLKTTTKKVDINGKTYTLLKYDK